MEPDWRPFASETHTAKTDAKILRDFTEISNRNGPDKLIPGWSAPSAIGIAGLGGGFEIGVEVSDLVIILNQRKAIEVFTKGGNLRPGGNCTVAVGPMGRNIEAVVAFRSTAAVFTYCRFRGLFAGIYPEGSYLIEHKDKQVKINLSPVLCPQRPVSRKRICET
ncbi:SH3 domain-containing YSC84-like protein 1 isoform X5 [Xyrichtys novacula]|uniref:SH3 domain-containing YSC84-like protein 1 isoform X5 n=1 Tax=Xyrichtys novacula TaxID=13765 RepID=A0AAV1HT91_XYRNO|nr:SH3 domain-containing YSC84-like protein 1 isoform X5 [Xyrichtys novacula]